MSSPRLQGGRAFIGSARLSLQGTHTGQAKTAHCLDDERQQQCDARVPVERIVFGSHAPYFPVETAILKLIESPLDAQQLQAIMQGNARRLLSRP